MKATTTTTTTTRGTWRAALLCLLVAVDATAALKILVVNPVFARSHLVFMGEQLAAVHLPHSRRAAPLVGRLADTYALAGHDVVLFEPGESAYLSRRCARV